jgi:hypothetical protein
VAVNKDEGPKAQSDAPKGGDAAREAASAHHGQPETDDTRDQELHDGSAPAAVSPPSRDSSEGPRSTFWMGPAYIGGLVLVFIGERILAAYPGWHWAATLLGIAAVVAATVARFSPGRGRGRRVEIERVLPILSLLGLFALALYFATTEAGADAIGISKLEPKSRERLLGILQVVWAGLLAISVIPMLFADAALHPMRHAERPEMRRVHAAAASGLTLVLAAIYGALFVYTAGALDWKSDHSYFKTSEPSDSTRNVARSLTDPVKVTAFFPQVSDVRNEVERYLRSLAAGVPKLQVEVRDRLLAPKLARDLHVTQDGVIILSRGTTTERLDVGPEMEAARAKLRTLDRDFQEKLMKMVRARRTAYLTVGHGEINDPRGKAQEGRSSQIVRMVLEKQNYQVKDLGLAQGLGNEVPDDAGLVMVLGPTEPLTPEELASLERYAGRGGHLLLGLDPDAVSTNTTTVQLGGAGEKGKSNAVPAAKAAVDAGATAKPKAPPPSASGAAANGDAPAAAAAEPPPQPVATNPSSTRATLEALARIAGLDYSPDLLANDRQHLRRRYNNSDRVILPTNRFSSHASVSTLSRNSAQAAVVVMGAGSLEPTKGAAGKVDVTVRSLPNTFADANGNYEPDDGEKKAVFNLAAAVTRPLAGKPAAPPPASKDKPQDKKSAPDEMRAFVVADADVFSDVAMSNAVMNQLLLVDAVRWLGGEESFAGAVNTEEDKHIEHTKQQDLVWFYGTIFGAPALVLGVGLLYSRHSRRPRGGRR